MRLAFTKMQGLGNDFIVFEAGHDGLVPGRDVFRRLADRRTGIGFDQALALLPARSPDTDVFYRIFNADGSEVEQCGNGARCIAKLIARKLGRNEVRMESPGARVIAQARDDGLVSVNMGEPNFDPASIPFEASRQADVYPLRVGEQELQISVVSMGNPHAVLRVPDVQQAPVDTVGPAVENHPRFAKKANVGFMQVLSSKHIALRVFERGAGETLACGTGACAAVVVGRKLGMLDQEVEVDARGGRMKVSWAGPGQSVWLTGPAVTVFEGTVEI